MTGEGLTGAIESAVAARGELQAGKASAAIYHLVTARHRFGFTVAVHGESDASRLLRAELVDLELAAIRAVEKLEARA